ncbi:protease [Pilatotrama ljubarskyi]|nr:protease [Pilatotrama ljubarskyi]
MVAPYSTILLALAVYAAAGPVPKAPGARIPFRRRHPLTTSEGIFDHGRAVRQVARDQNKHRNNLLNVETNLGREAFNEGAEIKPFVHPPPQRRQAENLTDHSDQYWAGSAEIGTPEQLFVLDFDTGSADLWVPSSSCSSQTCKSKHKYQADASSTSTRRDGVFDLQYGDGSSVTGTIYSDTVAVAGVVVKDQTFSAAEKVSDVFGTEEDDGILGLGYPALSSMRESPFFNSAMAQGAVKEGVFGMKLAAAGSELFLGGTDASLYAGELEYHPVTGKMGFWQIGGGKVAVGNTTVVSDIETIVDSGTTLIYGPPKDVATLYQSIPGSSLFDSENGFYKFPCDAVPSDVAFNWGGNDWTVSAENFNAGKVNEVECVGAIAAKELGLGKDVWLVGDSFMQNVYSAFSFDKNSVGFAALK